MPPGGFPGASTNTYLQVRHCVDPVELGVYVCVKRAAGGMDSIVLGTLHKYTSGFVGCLSNVTLANDYSIDLIADADDGRNVRQCSDDERHRRRHFTT